jgi:hypothetical protein
MRTTAGLLLVFLVVGVAGCSRAADTVRQEVASTEAMSEQTASASDAADAAAMAADPRLVVVHKNETCGCCHEWVEYLKKNGFRVVVRDVNNLGPIKERVGVPYGMGSCHTAEVGGYFLEGHVPAADIARLLEERPKAKGLTVPGMPVGSPGMEIEGVAAQPYDVHLVAPDGSTSTYAHHGSKG